MIDVNDNTIESIEIFNGVTAINFRSDKNLEKVKKLCYQYLKEKNTDLKYDEITKIAISSVEFELNKPVEYFLVAQLKNNETISMNWHLQNYQIDTLKEYIPEIFNLITKDEYEKILGFEINKAFDIHYDTNLISFVDVNGLNNFIDHKKGDYKKLKELRLYDKTPDHDWYDLDQKKYWWHTCHKKDKTPPKELEENFWAPYFIKIDDYGLYLVWINIEKGKYNLAEINGITNNEIPKSLIKTVSESLEIANEN